jgi:hypothetical protein
MGYQDWPPAPGHKPNFQTSGYGTDNLATVGRSAAVIELRRIDLTEETLRSKASGTEDGSTRSMVRLRKINSLTARECSTVVPVPPPIGGGVAQPPAPLQHDIGGSRRWERLPA